MKWQLLIATSIIIFFYGCSQEDGDYLGPFERTARTLTFGWDMWETDSVTPYELPMPHPEIGIIPQNGKTSFDQAKHRAEKMSNEEQLERGKLVYRRYCHQCHGPNGDSRIIVGESFGFRLPDLRDSKTQSKSDRQIFTQVTRGSEKMIPLGPTVDPIDLYLAINYVRTLAAEPSEPFFSPKNIHPLERLP